MIAQELGGKAMPYELMMSMIAILRGTVFKVVVGMQDGGGGDQGSTGTVGGSPVGQNLPGHAQSAACLQTTAHTLTLALPLTFPLPIPLP